MRSTCRVADDSQKIPAVSIDVGHLRDGQPGVDQHRVQSARNADAADTRLASRAGRRLAVSANATTTAHAATKLTASTGLTPNNRLEMACDTVNARPTPTALPNAATTRVRRSTWASSPTGVSPSARRIANSRLR